MTGLWPGDCIQKDHIDHIYMNGNTEETSHEISQLPGIYLWRMANEVKSTILSTEQQLILGKICGGLYYNFLSEWLPQSHKVITTCQQNKAKTTTTEN